MLSQLELNSLKRLPYLGGQPPQLLPAFWGLTAIFGMGTGVSLGYRHNSEYAYSKLIHLFKSRKPCLSYPQLLWISPPSY